MGDFIVKKKTVARTEFIDYVSYVKDTVNSFLYQSLYQPLFRNSSKNP